MHGFLKPACAGLLTSLTVILAACSGGDLAEGTKVPQFNSTPDNGTDNGGVTRNRFDRNSAGVGAFPDLIQLQNDFECKLNGANPVLGCYVAGSCVADTPRNESYLYLVDITPDRIRHQVLFFQRTTQCDGNFFKRSLSAMDMIGLTYGSPLLGSDGVDITPIDAQLASVSTSNARLSSAWVSSSGDRTCFAENDLLWGEDDSLGVLYFQASEPDERPTAIDFSNCLLRLN